MLQCLRQQVGNFPTWSWWLKDQFLLEGVLVYLRHFEEKGFAEICLYVIFKHKCVPSMPPRAQLAVESRQLGCLPSTVVSKWPFPGVLQKGLALFLSFFCTPIAAHWSSDDKRTGLSLASVPSSFSDACWTNGDESSVHCERDDLPCRCGRPVQYFFLIQKFGAILMMTT